MLNTSFFLSPREDGIARRHLSFQRNGVTSQTTRESIAVRRLMFLNHFENLVTFGSPLEPQTCLLVISYLFYFTSHVYQNNL